MLEFTGLRGFSAESGAMKGWRRAGSTKRKSESVQAAEQNPRQVNDEHDDDRKHDRENLARARDELGALRLDFLGAVLYPLCALLLLLHEGKLLALKRKHLRLMLELKALVVANFFEN
jgi:hypothetical protein